MDRYRKLKDHINILSVQFSPDGQVLATGASDNQIRVCSPQKIFHLFCSNLFRYGMSFKNGCESSLEDTKARSAVSHSHLAAGLLSLDHWITPFAYGIYGTDHQRSYQ